MGIVVDTCVVVEAQKCKHCFTIVASVLSSLFIAYANDELMYEYERILPKRAGEIGKQFMNYVQRVEATTTTGLMLVSDPTDQMVIESAIASDSQTIFSIDNRVINASNALREQFGISVFDPRRL